MKNFKVHYQIDGSKYYKDFSRDGVIDNETMNISVWHEIKKSHPSVREDDVLIISIEELNVL
jgi:hypothetical protein